MVDIFKYNETRLVSYAILNDSQMSGDGGARNASENALRPFISLNYNIH